MGPPPDQIADLVDETRAAAERTNAAMSAADASRCWPYDTNCADEREEVSQSLQDLEAALAQWDTYLP